MAFEIKIHHYHHFDGGSDIQALIKNLDRKVETFFSQLTPKVTHMANELSQLQSDVSNETSVIGSAVALLNGLKQQLDQAIQSGDPAALTALSAQIQQSTQTLADAVTANTPAASGGSSGSGDQGGSTGTDPNAPASGIDPATGQPVDQTSASAAARRR